MQCVVMLLQSSRVVRSDSQSLSLPHRSSGNLPPYYNIGNQKSGFPEFCGARQSHSHRNLCKQACKFPVSVTFPHYSQKIKVQDLCKKDSCTLSNHTCVSLSPYVGIIQIRFWVKASAYSQPACASTPFFNDFHYTHSPQKSKLCFP